MNTAGARAVWAGSPPPSLFVAAVKELVHPSDDPAHGRESFHVAFKHLALVVFLGDLRGGQKTPGGRRFEPTGAARGRRRPRVLRPRRPWSRRPFERLPQVPARPWAGTRKVARHNALERPTGDAINPLSEVGRNVLVDQCVDDRPNNPAPRYLAEALPRVQDALAVRSNEEAEKNDPLPAPQALLCRASSSRFLSRKSP